LNGIVREAEMRPIGSTDDDEVHVRHTLPHQRRSEVVNGFGEAYVWFFKRPKLLIGEAARLKRGDHLISTKGRAFGVVRLANQPVKTGGSLAFVSYHFAFDDDCTLVGEALSGRDFEGVSSHLGDARDGTGVQRVVCDKADLGAVGAALGIGVINL